MSWTFSRSVKFGPLRFNLSGKGIGISAGIPGFRVGTGPRGAFVSAGMGGFRYRQSLAAPRRANTRSQLGSAIPSYEAAPDRGITSTVVHDAASVLDLTESNGDDLLASMNAQARKWNHAWTALGALVLFLTGLSLVTRRVSGLFQNTFLGFEIVSGIVGACVVGYLWYRDRLSRLTVLFYEPDAEAIEVFTSLAEASVAAASVRRLQGIAQTSRYADSRRQAGASAGVKFGPATLSVGQAPSILSNLKVPLLKTARTTIAFFPDRALMFQGSRIGALSYDNLRVESIPQVFIEKEGVPADATVVGHTWRFVNNNGTPDRRFKNNRQIPQCMYSKLLLSNERGLDIQLMGSRAGSFDAFAQAAEKMRTLRLRGPIERPAITETPEPASAPRPHSGRRIADW